MPIFDYVCLECGTKEERMVKSHKDKVDCKICKVHMIKQVCAPNIGGMDHNGSSGKGKLPF